MKRDGARATQKKKGTKNPQLICFFDCGIQNDPEIPFAVSVSVARLLTPAVAARLLIKFVRRGEETILKMCAY